MKNFEFKIDTEAGVVVFCQQSHGRNFTSKTKASNIDEFNVGVGQLIAMKRNEIKIRKVDIKSMNDVLEDCKSKSALTRGTTASKLYANFVQIVSDKIKMSYNHIHELEKDLDSLYNKTYDVKPYDEIVNEHRIIRAGGDDDKKKVFAKPYAVPKEVIDGTHIFDIVDGSVTLKKL